MEGSPEPASGDFIMRVWDEYSAGEPVVTGRRDYVLADVEGFAWRADDGRDLGLVTWFIDGDEAEIVSVHALERGRGIGTRLMDAAEEELRCRGVKTAYVTTTNDNLRALSFYLRRGYRLVKLHPGAMDRVRQVKPQVPLVGNAGIPLRDMWELERQL